MSRRRSIVKNLIAVAIVACVGYFFYTAFRKNWESVRSYQFEPNYWALSGVAATTVIALLMSTYCWQTSINSLSTGKRKLTFSESVAAVNTSNLMKYVPGKLWSYALQIYWISSAGLKKSLIIYVNLLNLAIALLTSTLAGLLLLAFASTGRRLAIVLTAIIVIVLGDLLGMKFHTQLFRWGTATVNRLFKRQLEYLEFPGALLLRLHLVYFGAAALSGVSTYLLCMGIGYPIESRVIPLVMSSSLLGDVVGYLALVVPGGLGVREGVMYFVLGGVRQGPLALVLPLVSRTVIMVTDVLLGAVALWLLRTFKQPEQASDGS